MVIKNGGIGDEVDHRVLEELKVWGTVAKLWKQNMIPGEVKGMNSQRRWRDKVKELLMGRGLSEREGMVLARERESWVNGF